MKNDRVDVVLGMAILALLLFLGGAIGFVVYDYHHVDQINHDFTTHCTQIGGHAIISDKDLCVKGGLIVDHEG